MVTIGFSTTDEYLQRLIRWFTRSKTSHCWFSTELEGVPVIVHATIGGIKIEPRVTWEKHNKIVSEFAYSSDISEGVKHAFTLLGTKYDYVALLGYIFVIFWKRWFGKKIKNFLASPNAMVCSELLVNLAKHGSISEWENLDPERTTPQDLLSICESSESFTKIS